MGITTTTVEKLCKSDWLTSEPGQPYWNEGATDTGAVYEPSRPEEKAPPPNESDHTYEKSGPGETPYWHEGATDPGADYSPKSAAAKKLSMCEPITPDGEDWGEDDLGDVSDPEPPPYGFAPRALERQVARFAGEAGVLLARNTKKSTPVPPDGRPNGCDGEIPDGPYPEGPDGGSDRKADPESPDEPYDLPGLPPSWDEVLPLKAMSGAAILVAGTAGPQDFPQPGPKGKATTPPSGDQDGYGVDDPRVHIEHPEIFKGPYDDFNGPRPA